MLLDNDVDLLEQELGRVSLPFSGGEVLLVPISSRLLHRGNEQHSLRNLRLNGITPSTKQELMNPAFPSRPVCPIGPLLRRSATPPSLQRRRTNESSPRSIDSAAVLAVEQPASSKTPEAEVSPPHRSRQNDDGRGRRHTRENSRRSRRA